MRRTAEDAARTRSDLLKTALLVFAEQGVASTKLADVAERAGVTRGALYHHFTDKTELYATVVGESWDALTAPVWSALDGAGEPRERLTAFLVSWLRHLTDDLHFRALLTITLNHTGFTPAESAAKASGLDEWHARLELLLRDHRRGGHPVHPAAASAAAATVIAWLCGTAVLAATDPRLLPSGDAAGVAPLMEGLLP